MSSTVRRWAPVVSAALALGVFSGCGSSDDGGSTPSAGANARTGADTGAKVSADAQAITSMTTRLFGVPPQGAVPPIIRTAVAQMAVPPDQALIDKTLSCLGKASCPTGHGDLTIGLVADNLQIPQTRQLQAVALMQALRDPGVKSVLLTDGQGDPQKIISNMRSLMSQGAKLLVGNFGHGPALAAIGRQADQRGVVIAAASQGIAAITTGKNYIFVHNDLCDYGKEQARVVLQGSQQNSGGSVALMTGVPGNAYGGAWQPCAKQAFQAAGWKVSSGLTTNWTPQGEAQAAATLQASGGNVNAVAYDSDCTALVKAYLNSRKTPPTIAAAGAYPNCVGLWDKAKQQGRAFKAYTGNSQVWLPAAAVTAGLARLRGQNFPSDIVLPLPMIPFEDIVKTNPDYAALPSTAVFQSPFPASVTKKVLGS